MNNQLKWERIQGIVLDAVGTLIEPTPSVAVAYTQAAARQGVRLDVEEVRGRFKAAFRSDLVEGEAGFLSTDEQVERRRWREIVALVLPEVPDPVRAFDELWDHFGRPESWRAFPDAAPAVEAIREAGMKVCIGSNFDSRLHKVVAGLPELADAVEVIVVSSEVGYRKPHAAFFEAVCGRLGLPADRVLSVGDDLENDIQGAHRAGLAALFLSRDGDSGGLPSVAELTAVAALRAAEV
ncbi:HAD-IA family hydrolase [Planctomyces sp. SH-PL62]|uniref:HAD-IA family hydrolase n=1 Tax=Planctomyces sp. SH-PL62 TaxID=1636152 RepID=UPI00078DDE0B|nr:HAD-IA family hydrolase [Planctomyces sp. SH-PL62]AMV37494.1 Pyrimidine 5'-nucleotidase YjjG [Planctomyces sp. SH-PL62]